MKQLRIEEHQQESGREWDPKKSKLSIDWCWQTTIAMTTSLLVSTEHKYECPMHILATNKEAISIRPGIKTEKVTDGAQVFGDKIRMKLVSKQDEVCE